MNTRQRFGIAAILVALSALLSVLAAPSLPERLVTHWNAAGVPDDTMTKPVALAFLPGLGVGVLVMFALLPRLDPLGENIEAFRAHYDWLAVLLVGLLALLHAGIVAYNLGHRFDFTSLVFAGVAALLSYAGVVAEEAEQNWFVGFRTPWTLSDERVWDRTHALGGQLLKLTAVSTLVGLLVGEYVTYFLLVPVVLTAVVTFVHSYLVYRELNDPGDAADA